MNALDRLLARVAAEDAHSCWEWLGETGSTKGYGRFWLDGRLAMAHRAAYEILVGPIPAGLQLDHLCRNRGCVNPAHLEPVELATNVLRGVGLSAENARKTRCLHGHALLGSNLYIVRRTGARRCVACSRRLTREWRERQSA